MSAERLVPPLLVALLLTWLLSRSGIDSYVVTIPASALLAYVVSALGRLALGAAREREANPCAAWCLGLLASCLAVYAAILVLPITAAAAFAALAATVIAVELLLARRARAHRDPAQQSDWRSLAGFGLCVALTAAWCAGPAAAYEAVRAQGILPIWSDYFFHGGIISQFGDVRALGRGSIYLADYPSNFYHFASYGPAAALARVLDQPGLPLAGAAWLPLGFLAMLSGAYALGARLAGAAGGIAALAAVAILPDASNYGLRNGYFSFHWTLMAHAGATYALGAAFLSLALLDRWSVERARTALIASALLAASTLLFRAHIFVLYLPAWIAIAAVCTMQERAPRRRTAWLMVAGLAASAGAASLIIGYLADSGFWRVGRRALEEFLIRVHIGQEPTAYDGLYEQLIRLDLPAFTLPAGIALAIVAAFGALVILLPAAALLAGRAGALKPIDSACAYLFFWWLLVMLFAPEPWHPDPTDLIHRPLVLLYAACAIWTLCLGLRVLKLSSKLWPALLAGAVVALPLIGASADEMARAKFAWGRQDAAARVVPGLVEAAGFLREHAAVGDIFAAGGLTADYAPFDLSMQLCALSGMPAYLSRPYIEMMKDPPRKKLVAARLRELQAVDALTDHREAMRTLRALNVQWYVVPGEQGPRWDPERKRAAFSARSVALYAAKSASSSAAFHDEMGVRDADQVVTHEAVHALELAAGKPLVRIPIAHMPSPVE